MVVPQRRVSNLVEREGLVFKEESVAPIRFSFKGISNKYLLKQKE